MCSIGETADVVPETYWKLWWSVSDSRNRAANGSPAGSIPSRSMKAVRVAEGRANALACMKSQ